MIELHDSIKHDVSGKLFSLMLENRRKAKTPIALADVLKHGDEYAYHVGYDQAIIDMQNWLIIYTNTALERKR